MVGGERPAVCEYERELALGVLACASFFFAVYSSVGFTFFRAKDAV